MKERNEKGRISKYSYFSGNFKNVFLQQYTGIEIESLRLIN